MALSPKASFSAATNYLSLQSKQPRPFFSCFAVGSSEQELEQHEDSMNLGQALCVPQQCKSVRSPSSFRFDASCLTQISGQAQIQQPPRFRKPQSPCLPASVFEARAQERCGRDRTRAALQVHLLCVYSASPLSWQPAAAGSYRHS